jgi:uncharacterized protein related to proFAR isomerase
MPTYTLTIQCPDPAIMRVNMAAQAVRSAYIVGEIHVFDVSGRVNQKASFAVDCAEEDYPAFAAALQGSGCHLLNESYKVEAIEEEEEEEEVEVDLSVLDLSIGKLGEALATGDYDDQLDELLDAEEAGKTRKGAVAALKARMESL